MQSHLGDYEGSRINPEMKLERAINSFLNQTYNNSELILIADNCKKTEEIYNNKFSNDERIKFQSINDNSKKMYHHSSDGVFFRGYPRQKGLETSTGDIIAYLDSDDFITSDYLEHLARLWSQNNKYFWFSNTCWWENHSILDFQPNGYFNYFENLDQKNVKKIQGLDSLWILSNVKTGKLIMSPALISHRKDCNAVWQDYLQKDSSDFSEDMIFIQSLMNTHGKGARISVPGYVRCHLKKFWDF